MLESILNQAFTLKKQTLHNYIYFQLKVYRFVSHISFCLLWKHNLLTESPFYTDREMSAILNIGPLIVNTTPCIYVTLIIKNRQRNHQRTLEDSPP